MNPKEKSDIFEAISIQKSMMEATGIWPRRNPTLYYKLKNYTIMTLIIIFLITVSMEICYTFIHEDYQNLTELLSFFCSATSYIPKQFIFGYKSGKFMGLLEDLRDEKFKMYPRELDKHVRRTNRYALLLIRFYQITVSVFILVLLLKPFYTSDDSAIRFTVYDLGKWMVPFHLYQVTCIIAGCWNNTTLDALALGLISLGTAQLEILRDKLLNIRKWAGFTYDEVDDGKFNLSQDFDEEIDAKIEERIKECVQHHLAIIKFLDGIEELYSYYFLVQFFNSVLAICNTWFQFQLTDEFVKLVYLLLYSIALCTQLLFYCFYGDNLILKSLELKDACYNSEWYKCSPRVRKSLMIIMERTKRPVILTAGKFMTLSLITYTALLRSSYSYFALMNQVSNKN